MRDCKIWFRELKQINAQCSEVKLPPLKFALGILSQNVEDLKIKK